MLVIGQILTVGSLFSIVLATEPGRHCKAIPGSQQWPQKSAWGALNRTVAGNLIAPTPPGAVCHPDQPTYSNSTCATVAGLWTTSWAFHSDDPISTAGNTWSNDSCLPDPQLPCSGLGYPAYVVNASTAEHVQAGINFARENNIRLVVKGTGHDYRGRTVAPHSISIWTRHLRGLSFHESYQASAGLPASSADYYNGAAITIAAGENLGSAFAFANEHNSMIIAGSSKTVGPGGFLTGGGQSLISIQKGLGADAVLEFSIVLPSGEIITANACQNEDIFWAVRGGGGSTFGVILNFTVKAFASEPVTSLQFGFLSPTLNHDKFWEAMKWTATQFPMLSNSSITVYSSMGVGSSTTSPAFAGTFCGVNKSAIQTMDIIQPLAQHLNTTYGAEIQSQITDIQEWVSYYEFWNTQPDNPGLLGSDAAIASRILDGKALNHPDFVPLLKKAAGTTGAAFNVVVGPGTHAYPTDFNAVSPAWRTGYVHAIVAAVWSPLDEAAMNKALHELTYNTSQALRDLAPDTGCYLNEANAFEPNFQKAFWGSNYPRLLGIKRAIDPDDVFWCQVCAGSERWEVVDDVLCMV